MKNRQYTIIFLFIFITIGLSAYSFLGNFDSLDMNANTAGSKTNKNDNDESYFKVVDYFLIDSEQSDAN